MKILLLPVLAMLVAGCQSAKPPAPPRPGPKKVVVTDVAPSSAVVERSVARVEARVAEASSKVDAVSESVEAAVEKAIRANDSERIEEMRLIRVKVEDLKAGVKIAEAQTEAMAEEVASTKALVAKMQGERDTAWMDHAKAIAAHEQAEKLYEVNLEHQKGLTSVEKARGDSLSKWVWRLGVTLGVIVLAGTVYLTLKLTGRL